MKQADRRLLLKTFFSLAAAIVVVLFTARNSPAELKTLSDDQLSGVYAVGFSTDINGFSDFSIIQDAVDPTTYYANASFNIYAYTFTEIDSLKLGYHDEYDYKNPTPGFGWDQDWENLTLGESIDQPANDLYAAGFYLEAEFKNIDDPTGRELKAITFGVKDLTGDISADFISFSGTIDDSDDLTPEYNGHGLNLGTKTITAGDFDGNGDASEFSISFSIDGYDKGYWVTFSEATVN